MISLFESIILGLVQGLTEFIPVSSSGHLVIAQNFFSGASDHLFLEFVNIGTLLALLVFFRKRIIVIIQEVAQRRQSTLARNILITSVPAGLVGYFLADFIANSTFFGSVIVVIITLSAVGVIMIVLDKLPQLSAVKNGAELSKGRALLIGFAQMLALIPGVSRSGSTIITGRLVGMSAKESAEYSFLASLPVMIGVTIKLFVREADRQYFIQNLDIIVVSNIVAFISGFIAVGFLMRYLSRHGLALFGWYRIGLAAILTLILLIQ